MTNLLYFLIGCILTAIVLGILYWIIKNAVRAGILEARRELENPEPQVKYPIKIDEDHPDLPFREEET